MKALSLHWVKIILVVTLLAMLVGGAWFYRSQERVMQAKVQGDLLAVARLKANQISAWRKDQLDDAAAIQDQAFLVQSVTRFFADSSPGNEQDLRARLRNLARQHNLTDILLVDPTGNDHLSLSGPLHQHSGYKAVLATALREQVPEFIDLHTEAQAPKPHLAVIVPLLFSAGQSRTPLGALILVYDASRFLYPLIEFWPTQSKTAETLIVRRNGDHVTFLNALRYRPPGP